MESRSVETLRWLIVVSGRAGPRTVRTDEEVSYWGGSERGLVPGLVGGVGVTYPGVEVKEKVGIYSHKPEGFEIGGARVGGVRLTGGRGFSKAQSPLDSLVE